MLEVAIEAADWATRNQEPCGIVSCRDARLHREFTGPLWCLLEVYQATWREKYADVARRSLNWLLRLLDKGRYPDSVFTRGERGDEAVVEPYISPVAQNRDVYHMYAGALRLSDSQALGCIPRI